MDSGQVVPSPVGHDCAVIVATFVAATLGGLVILRLASDQFVVGASPLAVRLNISPLVA